MCREADACDVLRGESAGGCGPLMRSGSIPDEEGSVFDEERSVSDEEGKHRSQDARWCGRPRGSSVMLRQDQGPGHA